MIEILILSSLLCLGSAWNQPSICYTRKSSCSCSSEIQELRRYFQNEMTSHFEAITSTLEQLVEYQNCLTPTTDPLPTTESLPTSDSLSTTNPSSLIGTFENPATSCSEISSDRSSGYYWLITNSETSPLQVYCDTNRTSCSCNTMGGWMRVANFDMTNPNQNCSDGFRLITRNEPPLRTCGRTNTTCVSTTYPVHGVPYSQVCGRIIAYQDRTTDAFNPYLNLNANIDDWYVDGVSLTHGQSPRQHIWTFAAAVSEISDTELNCPCLEPSQPFTVTIPSFVGNDYFCDTANLQELGLFHSDDPLWNGAGCEGNSTCCQFNNPPWFCKQLLQPSTDDIELRLCGDESADNEDVPLEMVEIFIR